MDSSKFTLHLLHHTVNSTATPSNSTAPDDSSSNPNESDQFEQRLFDLTDQLSSSGYSQPSVLNNLVVESAVVGQQHLAFLLDNGHVCRLNYQFNGTISGQTSSDTISSQPSMSSSSSRSSKHSKLSTLSSGLSSGLGSSSSSGSFRPSSRTISSSSFVAAAAAAVAAASTGPTTGQQSTNSGNSSSNTNQLTGNSSSSSGSSTTNNTGTSGSGGLLRANEAFIIPSPHDILSSSSLSHGFGRGRRNQLLRSRVSNLIVGSSRMPPFVPASAVPESLIESVQTVLQSKSRSVIIRELQRTNLDVNLAVNNLLQRDDEGDDPTDDEDPYMHGDDLISLLDINSHHGESVLLEADGALFDEDSFRLSRRLGSGRTHGSSTASVITSGSGANSGATETSNTGSHTSSSGGNNANSGSSSEPIDRESSSRKSSYRIRDQRWYDSYRDELFTSSNSSHHHRSSSSSHHGNSNADASSATAKQADDKKKQQFSFGDQLKYWTDKNGEPIKFIKIAGMHSELIGVSADGKLHQWKWNSESPFNLTINISTDQTNATPTTAAANSQQTGQITVNHPKTLFLQLFNERICGMSTSNVRASCWTESGKIASWLDETIDIPATVKYQTPAQQFVQPQNLSEGTATGPTPNTGDIILEMSTSNLFTLIRMSSGLIFWWGIMPFEQRAKLIEKYQSKQQKSKSSSSGTEITVGSYVSLKSLPLYNNGTVGFTVKDGIPRLGQINEHVFMLRDSKAFKFKTKPADSFIDINGQSVDMPPPPSPSEQPPLPPPTPLTGSLKRKKQYSSTGDLSASSPTSRVAPDDEEYWHLNDVVFVEDFKSSTILGKVIKVDNDYVLVQVAPKANSASEVDSPAETLLLDNSRIFQKNQLQLVKQSSSLKLPDFMQKTPKKLSDFGAILTIAAHQNGLHAIITKENSLFYVQYDLLSNKIMKEKRFTTSLSSFLGRNPGNISFFAQDNPSLNLTALFDGNSTIYPLNDLSGSNTLKSPEWKNLFPVKCFTSCLLPPITCRQNKQTVRKIQCVTFFAMRMEQLMASIFRCDYNRVVKIIRQLETDLGIGNPNAPINTKRLKKILNERCDGNRNIFHAAVYVCAPVSNNTLNAIHNASAGSLPGNNNPTGLQTGSQGNQSNLRPSKFSDGLADIYAAYGTSGTSSSGSNAQAKPATIERPWSTSNKSSDVRKINISLEPKPQQQQQQQQQESAQTNSNQSVSTSDPETASNVNTNNQGKAEAPEGNNSGNNTNKSGGIPTSFWPPLPPTNNQATPDTNEPSNKLTQIWSAVKLTEKERKQNALKILHELLNTPVFQLQQSHTTTTTTTTAQTAPSSPANCDYLYELLSHKSADGQTPFMYAVNIRAYEAAIMLFDQSIKIRNAFVQNQLAQSSGNVSGLNYNRDLLFTNLVFPLGSRTDQSPLYVLCSNDTCSFTWTGDNHITQDIFECRTCTLVGNLCCCTECARTCHKGHDCKIKTSSPTAYCDCWEKCKCKSLIAGDQEKRFSLLEKLLGETNLLSVSFFKGESLLIYLAQTVSRQILEQRNYKRVSGTMSSSSSTASSNSSRNNRTGTGYGSNTESGSSNFGLTGSIGDMPQHDLEPPKFSRRALEKVFTDWYSVKQIFLFNKSRIDSSKDSENETKLPSYLFNNGSLLFDDSVYSDAQSGCVDLDKFIYILIMKCPSDLVTVLVDTIQKKKLALANTDESSDDFKEVDFIVRRLIRSVVRLFVILCIETAPSSLNANLSIGGGPTVTSLTPANTASTNNNAINRLMSPTKNAINSRLARFKSLSSGNSGQVASLVTISPIAKCEYILRQFASDAVQELADSAHSIIMPVVLGLSKPSTFKLSGSAAGSGNTFNNNSSGPNSDYMSMGSGSNSSLGNTGGHYALAEEIFNLESSLHRQFTSSISTTLITPAPVVKKEPVQQQPTSMAAAAATQQQPKNSSFKNTFTEAGVVAAPTAKQTADKAKATTGSEAKTSASDVSMPPPAQSSSTTSPGDASNQQQSMYIDSDTNQSSSSTSSHSSAGSATGNEATSKSSKSKSHLARSVSSNSDNSNSNSNSSSGGESSSSEANSSDTTTSLATASSNSTANTKRSTIAYKSGRTRSTKSGKKSSSSRRVVQFNTSFSRKSSETIQSQDDFSDKDDDVDDEDEEGDEDEEDGDEEDEDEEDGDEDDDDENDVYDKYENEIMSPSNEEQESTQGNLEDDFISRANIEDATNSSEASSVNTGSIASTNNRNSNSASSNVNPASSSGGSKRRRLLINRGPGMLSSSSRGNNANIGTSSHQIASDNSSVSVQLGNRHAIDSRTETEPPQPYIANLVNNQSQQQQHHHHQYQHHHHQTHNVHQHHYNHVNILPTSNSSISGPIPQTEAVSSFNTPSSNAITNNTLGRVFSILIKLIRELMNTVYAEKRAQLTQSNNQALIKNTKTGTKSERQRNQRLVFQALKELIDDVNRKLDAPWRWLVSLMDATEAQLRFGASLSSSVGDFGNNTNALQYLRHLEERALLSNYFNNNCGNGYNYYASNNIGGSGPFVSSRFGSGIDARRKLNIMQHQHQQFASLHSNQASPLFPITNNQPPNYYQSQAIGNSTNSGQGSGFGGRAGSSNNSAVPNAADLGANSSQQPPIGSSAVNSGSSNQVTATSLASQFASAQILTTRKDFLSYTLSLMRTNSNEHRDSLPSIDISLLKHAAYIFDGILFYLKCSSLSTQLTNAATSTQSSSSSANTLSTTTAGQAANVLFTLQDEYNEQMDENENDLDSLDSENNDSDSDDEFNRYFGNDFANKNNDSSAGSSDAEDDNRMDDANSDNEIEFDEDTASEGQFDTNDESQDDEQQAAKLKHVSQRDAPFFRRSSSTLCLGANAPDPFFYSLEEALPLATRPHLLQPHVRIQDMFRVRSNHIDQFLSLSHMGLMASDQRVQVPALRGPSLFTTSRGSNKTLKRKSRFNPSSQFGIKIKKIDLEKGSKASKAIKSKWSNSNNSKFLNKFEARLFKIAQLQSYKKAPISQLSRPSELVERWRLTVDLFGRVFCDDVGLEPGSIIRQLGGFQLKEAKFRREMERLRNTANRELLMEVERDRDQLLQMTFKSLNNMYNLQNNRRAAASASLSTSSSSNLLPPVLCLNRIKVTFRDEQGEGSGVARSFYTAFCEAVLADLPLPNLDAFYNQTASLSNSASSLGNVSYVPFNMLHRYRNTRNLDSSARRQANSVPSTPTSSSSSIIPGVMTTGSAQLNRSTSSLRSRDSTPTGASNTGSLDLQGAEQQSSQNSPTITSTNAVPLSINAPAFFSPLIAITSTSTNLTDLPSFDMSLYNSLDSQHREYGQQLYTRINQHLANNASNQQSSSSASFRSARITGMILELRSSQIQQIINSDQLLRARIDEGLNLLAGSNSSTVSPQVKSQEMTTTATTSALTTPTYQSVTSQLAPSKPLDNTPLFWQPDKTMAGAGFFSPRAGQNTQPRLNAFRNVGRIMAICLLQNELCPITLSRHCIKYILGRPIRWHDLAFFDSQMYESFRKMIKDAENVLVGDVVHAKQSDHKTVRAALMATVKRVDEDMFKPLDLTFNIDLPKEEGGNNNDLVENGSKIEVTCLNMYEFVKKYAEFRMVKNAELCLQELKNGVYDVLPASAFEGLTAEDFRLLLNGVADISIHTLASYTTISDESKESNRRPQFEKWFWATLEKMNHQEKQELLFFWTGSPYLPASEEGFQPLPTITLRPPSDQHLPTANTCINRLYLPMYSSKSILKAKILQAIKTKTFGFV